MLTTASSHLFFFKQKTAYEMVSCDWSSDVCSSDLAAAARGGARVESRNGLAVRGRTRDAAAGAGRGVARPASTRRGARPLDRGGGGGGWPGRDGDFVRRAAMARRGSPARARRVEAGAKPSSAMGRHDGGKLASGCVVVSQDRKS